jgi:hypothetical protein
MKTRNLAAWEQLGSLTISATCLLPLLPFAMVGLSG